MQKKEQKQLLTEQKKREKEERQIQKRKESRKTRPEKVSQASMQIVEELAELQLPSSSEAESDNAICPKCGAEYGGLWVCCNGCDQWFNVEFTSIKKICRKATFLCV